VCQPPRARVRSRAPRSRFASGLFRFSLRTARDILVFDVVVWVVFLLDSILRSLLMGGMHNTGSIMNSVTTSYPLLSHVVFHTSELIEWIMNGCPVKSGEIRTCALTQVRVANFGLCSLSVAIQQQRVTADNDSGPNNDAQSL